MRSSARRRQTVERKHARTAGVRGKAARERAAYRVHLAHEDGGWSARVEGLPGCRAQASTIPRVCAQLRLALPDHGVPRTATFELVLGSAMGARVKNLRVLRERTERAAREMHDETRRLTASLAAQGLTVRDIGELLGVSYQRVQQIIRGE